MHLNLAESVVAEASYVISAENVWNQKYPMATSAA